ncbi:amino acid adenylation domain-containing protein [Gordonia alkanivorans]|uniref:amino acid adenylation domain-containing protein n=1 Tax=Gordonia alkanivorans TaxID=84096 RepID=UPI0024B6B138|nr:non-ribosomal peptide synthetase [Gordonia alkanivorans]MDJ0025656.1 amino acid adenylation domain-containing protein [Gordonia alkanivorans]
MAIANFRVKTSGDVDGTDDVLPLTAAQRGMWFAESLSSDYSVNIAQYVDIRHEPGGLDYDLLARCCVEVGKLVESPYVRLAEVDGVPVQYVDLDFDQHVDTLDLRHESDPEAAALAWMQQEYRRPVDLLTDQFIVITIIKVADDRTFWYNRAHHIIIDGYAALSIMRRTVDRYNALRRGDQPQDKLPATMADIVAYEDAYRTSSRRDTDREHWLERVTDLPERVTLSASVPSAPLSFDNVVVGDELAPALQARLEALATDLNSSIAVVLTAAFGAFLSRMAGTDDIVMSLPVTGRATAKIKAAGGMLSNILPIRLRDVSQQSGRDLVRSAQLELTGALRHQRYRSDDIRRDAGLDGSSVSFGPTINMVFFDDQVAIDGTTMEYRILTSGILEDLLINLYQSSPDAPLVVDLHGNPHLYSSAQMAAHHRHFLAFLQRFIDDVDARVDDIELLLPGEGTALLRTGTGERVDWPLDGGVLDAFATRVLESPDAVALVSGEGQWTYRDFDAVRNQLAHQLIADGVRPGDRVVVALDRGVAQVTSIYAAMTAGAAYVPVDPTQPEERRWHIVDTAQPALVIDEEYLGRIGFEEGRGVPGRPSGAVSCPRVPDMPAYVIFTSGSTGTPKGVEVRAEAINNRLAWMQRNHPISPADAVLYKTPFTFDVSVWELLWPLQIGASMVIAEPGGHRDPDYLSRLIDDRRISVLHFVPSMLHAFVDVAHSAGRTRAFGESVRQIFTSGEALGRQLADRVLEQSDAKLVNLYGPTEAAVDITEHVVAASDPTVPIGTPVANSDVYVLDSALRPVPKGVAGELYLAGCQLASGYVRRPDLTSSTFVANPYSHKRGRRMYRTGDLVRWSQDGELEYLGRTDFQVKIRGQRVELGEIEAVLCQMPAVEGAVVVARTDLSTAPMLVAYLTAGSEGVEDADALEWCRRRLPSHMVPAAAVVLDRFPVNSSGKLDRKALPNPVLGRSADTPYVPPSTPLEVEVIGLIEELLQVDRIGLRDNIFTLGADSLVAARLASRLRTVGRVRVSLTDIFESRDVGALIAAAKPLEGAAAQVRPLAPRSRPDRIPLSYPQNRVWFINRLDPKSGAYNVPGAVRLGGDVDAAALSAAIADVVARHEPLRTTFPDDDGETFQLIHPAAEAAAAGLFGVDEVEPSAVDSAIHELASAGFDLAVDYPVRVRLLRTVDEHGQPDHVLVMVMHHIISDGASLGPLIKDVLSAYFARVHGVEPVWSPLPVQYADFTLWQRELLGDESDASSLAGQQIAFWRNELRGMPELISLPADRPRPTVPTGAGGHFDTWLDARTVARLRAVAAESEVTIFAVFHAALALLLSRVSDTRDIAIGTALAGRDEPELTDLIGMFVNTVVLRTRIDPDATVAELLRSAHHTRAQALSNADVPFELVVDAVGARRSRSHSPLFQVELVLQHDQVEQLLDSESELDLIDARTPFAKYDLSLSVVDFGDSGPHADEISIAFTYAEDLFDRATIERFARYFHEVLDALAGSHESAVSARVADVFRFPAGELARVAEWSAGPSVEVLPQLIPDAVAEQVRAAPDAPALVFGDRTVTYREFGARVADLARSLISVGVGPDVAVAVCVPRSVELLVAVHAIVTAGGHYVPIDTEAPIDRGEYMVETAGADVVVVGPGVLPSVVADLGSRVTVITVDSGADVDPSTSPLAAAERRGVLRPDHAAYTLFTSGSTGRPKGVTVSHRAIANRLAWMQDEHLLSPSDTVVQKTPVTFDVSVWELFWPLMTGAGLVIAEPGRHGDPQYLADLVDRHRVTTVHFVPSMLSTFVDVLGTDRLRELSALRLMFTSGEALTAATAQVVIESIHGIGLHNLYGPTEAAVDVTEHTVAAGEATVPIGRPIWNTTTRVLDGHLRPVPVGVPGELYLGGVQLARGYAAQSRLTAERFVADPFGAPGDRLYRTGDLVRWNSAGGIEYLGRNDFQVKLRGQRLELGEIEAALMSVPAVVHAAATVADLPAGQSLVAYYSPDTVDPAAAQGHLTDLVPEYMVPTIWMPLAEMPLNSAGKVDRKALPEPVIETAEFVPPATDTEHAIAGVFADVLGVDQISVTESFFDLGGNSLSATKVAARLSSELRVEIPVVAVFDAPSVRQMAAFAEHGAPSRRPRLAPRSGGHTAPLSPVQRGMWLINRADPASPAYNVAMALRLSGRLDTTAIRAAIEDLVERHESLRTKYPLVDGEPMQVILEAGAALELLERSVVDVEGDPIPVIADFTGRGFDVTAAPPLRMVLLRLTDEEHILVFVVHHISADGASMLPLAGDVMTAYSARVAGQRPGWAPLEVQYLDYTLWQLESLGVKGPDDTTEAERQLAYWVDRLRNAPARLELPTDHARPRTPSFLGDEVRFEIDGALVRKLDTVARHNNATLFMVMQTALVVLLSRLTTQRDIVIGTPFAGRGQPELDGVIGMFVNTLALRTRLQDEEKFAELLHRVRDEDLADMANAEIAFDTIVSSVLHSPPTSYNPIYQVMFAYQNFTIPRLDMHDMTIAPISEQLTPAKVDLQLTLYPDDFGAPAAKDTDSMTGQLIYAADVFTRGTVETYAQRYLRVLEEVAENPQALVGDITIATADEDAVSQSAADVEATIPLPDLVARASIAAPDAVAAAHSGTEVTFAVLSSMCDVMAAALPDPDSALATALMSLMPGLAASSPDSLGEVLAGLRTNAAHAIESFAGGGHPRGNDPFPPTEGMTQT